MTAFTIRNSADSAIVRSRTYRYRYRARNCVGWGTLSDELNVLAADVPNAPPSPTRSSSSSTSISLLLYPTHDNGGAIVTNYKLYRNAGTDGTSFVEVTSYVYSTNGF